MLHFGKADSCLTIESQNHIILVLKIHKTSKENWVVCSGVLYYSKVSKNVNFCFKRKNRTGDTFQAIQTAL